MLDDATYGFSKPDALELVQLIGGADGENREWHEIRGGGLRLYKATMNEPWTAGVAECSIYTIDGVTFTDTGTDADVYDGLNIFTSLTTGDHLLELFQSGKYYAIQAPCP